MSSIRVIDTPIIPITENQIKACFLPNYITFPAIAAPMIVPNITLAPIKL